jgi:GMP synthase-like glutamine amidotransferase
MGNAWGVQFHPEFDADVMRFYLRQFRQVLIDEGQEPVCVVRSSL